MHVEAWGLNHPLYLPYVMHGRPSVAASFSLRPQDSLWDGAHDARLTGDVVDEILGAVCSCATIVGGSPRGILDLMRGRGRKSLGVVDGTS